MKKIIIKIIAYLTLIASITACGATYGTYETCKTDTFRPLGYEMNQGRDITNTKLIKFAADENQRNNSSLSTWLFSK